MRKSFTIYFFISVLIIAFSLNAVSQVNDTLNRIKPDTIDSVTKMDSSSFLKTVKKVDAIESQVIYKSKDSIIFDVTSKLIYVYGEGDLTYEDILLKSEYVSLDMNEREVFARGVKDSLGKVVGPPNFTQGKEVFDADTLRYNFKSKEGFGYGIITEAEGGYLHSEKTKIHEDKEIHMIDGKYTTCDLPEPHFYIGMTKAKVIPNNQIVTGPAYIVIEDITLPLVLPFGFFPTRKGRTNGILIPNFGDDALKGYYFKDGGVYFGFSDYLDFKLLGEVYTLGSWLINATSNYKKKYRYSGSLNFSYSSLVYDEVRQDPTYNIQWNHNQDRNANPNRTFGASVNFGSIAHTKLTADNESELINNTTRSSVNYSRNFAGTPFKLVLAFNHNQNFADSVVSLTLPDLNFTMSSLNPFKRKNSGGRKLFFEDIRLSYTLKGQNKLIGAKMDSAFYTTQTLNEFNQAFYHSIPISYSFKLFKFLSIDPSISFTDRMFFDKYYKEWDPLLPHLKDSLLGGVRTDTIPGFYNVYDYNFSVSTSTKIYGMYTFRSKYVKAIRHLLTPRVSFNYSPDFGTEKYGYYGTYNTDSTGAKTKEYYRYPSMGYSSPGSNEAARMLFSLSNNLEMKVRDLTDTVTGTRKIKLIESFTISSGYDFLRDSLKLDLISLSGVTTLFKRFKINYTATLDPYALVYDADEKDLVRSNTYMAGSYGRLWRKDDSKVSTGASFNFGPLPEKERYNVDRSSSALYNKFNIPWSLSIGYSISIPRVYYYNINNEIDSVSSDVNQSLSISGNFKLTPKWRITFRTGWDIKEKSLTYTSIDIYRDLHCWEMSLNWIPNGSRQRWEFVIRIKADMFKDVKYEMKSPNAYF